MGTSGRVRTAIKHLAQIKYGLGQPPKLSLDGIPIIRATNINRGKITNDNLIFASKRDLPLDRAPLLKAGEVLVVRSGAYTGDSALVTEEWAGSSPGYDLRLVPLNIESRFLAYALQSLPVQEQIDLAKSRAAQPHLNAEELGEVLVDLPSVDEQYRVVQFLDDQVERLDGVYSRCMRQVDLMRERRRAVIEHRLMQSFEVASSIPVQFVGWPSYEAGRPDMQVLSVYRDHGVIPKGSRQDNFNKTPDDLTRYLVVRPGDIVINKMKAWQGSIAISVHSGIVSPDYLVVRPVRGVFEPLYLHYVLRSPRMTGEYAARSVGIRPSQWRLYWDGFKKVVVPMPDLAVQRALLAELRGDDRLTESLITAILRRSDLVQEKRQALITAAVTGQIDVATARGADA